HRRREQAGLRAEVTVLGAAAGLDRHDALDLDLRPAPAHPHFVGELQQLGQPLVGQAQYLHQLILGKGLAAFEHLLARDGQHVGSSRSGHTNSSSTPGHGVRIHPNRFAPGLRPWRDAGHAPSTCSVNRSGSNVPPSHGDSPAAAASVNASPVSSPIPSGRTPSNGAPAAFGRSSMLQRSARSGFSGQLPTTTPATSRPRRVATSAVSAVAFRVPSPERATTISGAASAHATSARLPPWWSIRTSRPPAPSTSTRSCVSASSPAAAAASAGVTGGRPLRRAAVSGGTGSG